MAADTNAHSQVFARLQGRLWRVVPARLTRRAARLALLAAVSTGGIGLATPALAADLPHTYYVSASGNDAADGTSPATAWRTLQAVSSHVLAGATVLLEGGSTFAGPLNLDGADSGVTVDSFGTGHARITAKGTDGVFAWDISAITVRDIDLIGDAAAFASKGGLDLYNDQPAGHRLSGVTISGVTVQGFKNGVEIGGAKAGAGFGDVSIADVTATGNRDNGVITYGPAFNAKSPSYANANVNVVRTAAIDNLGNPANKSTNSGNGIVLGSVDVGSITDSTASGNGLRCVAPEGPAGIWTYDSNDIQISQNTATGNRTGGSADGDGFDLDQNVSNSFLDHNTSSGNDGAGYLVYTGQSNSANHGNVVSSNSSVGDAQKNSWYGGITLGGKLYSVAVTDNTIDATTSASNAPALAIKSGVTGATTISANRLTAAAGHSVVVSPKLSRTDVAITSNQWAASVAQSVQWGSVYYASISAWTKATGQS